MIFFSGLVDGTRRARQVFANTKPNDLDSKEVKSYRSLGDIWRQSQEKVSSFACDLWMESTTKEQLWMKMRCHTANNPIWERFKADNLRLLQSLLDLYTWESKPQLSTRTRLTADHSPFGGFAREKPLNTVEEIEIFNHHYIHYIALLFHVYLQTVWLW